MESANINSKNDNDDKANSLIINKIWIADSDSEQDDRVKSKFSKRKDVVYKTLLRNTRRYLWKIFSPEFGNTKFWKRTCGCPEYK